VVPGSSVKNLVSGKIIRFELKKLPGIYGECEAIPDPSSFSGDAPIQIGEVRKCLTGGKQGSTKK
jgi:hypothetical protein